MMGPGFATLFGRGWSASWRGRSGYGLRALYAGVLLFYSVVLLLPVWFDRWGFGEIAEEVRGVYFQVCMIQFVLATLIGPIVFARPLLQEKEESTLDLLLVSPARRFVILLGSASGHYLAFLTLFLSGLPALCFLKNFGGLTYGEILSTHLILAGHMALIAGISVLLALVVRRSYGAFAIGWGLMLGYVAAPTMGRVLYPSLVWLWDFWEGVSTLALLKAELLTVWPQPGTSLVVAACGGAILVAACGVGSFYLDREGSGAESGARQGWVQVTRAGLRRLGSARILRRCFPGSLPRGLGMRGGEGSPQEDAVVRALWFLYVAAYFTLVAIACWLPASEELFLHMTLINGGTLAGAILFFARISISTSSARADGTLEVLLGAGAEPVEIVGASVRRALILGGYLLAPVVVHALGVYLAYGPWTNLPKTIVMWLGGVILGLIAGVVIAHWISMKYRSVLVALVSTVITAPLAAGIAWLSMYAGPYVAVLAVPPQVAILLFIYGQTVKLGTGTDL